MLDRLRIQTINTRSRVSNVKNIPPTFLDSIETMTLEEMKIMSILAKAPKKAPKTATEVSKESGLELPEIKVIINKSGLIKSEINSSTKLELNDYQKDIVIQALKAKKAKEKIRLAKISQEKQFEK